MSPRPFQLLELNLKSAQDLPSTCRNMHTYAVAWTHPHRKLTTRTDPKGHNNPRWNHKFVFRVTDEFLSSEDAVLVIELYSQGWVRDMLVGSTRVPVLSLIPTAQPNQCKPTRRHVALQIRRPSGRPQGILNVDVSLLDATMRSMPLFSDTSSGLGYQELVTHKPDPTQTSDLGQGPVEKRTLWELLRRTKSERSWTEKDDAKPDSNPAQNQHPHGYGSAVNGDTGSSLAPRGAAGGNGSLCTDVGPSPSVVAAAMAKGLYLPPTLKTKKVKDDGESSILQWTDDQSEEGLRSKIERWRTEMHPINGRDRMRDRRGDRRRRAGGGRLFRCFGKAFGIELTIVCGSDNKRKHPSGGSYVDV